MTLTTITHAGQASGWLGQINTALDALNNAQTDTGWTAAGVTQVNGTTPACKYRVVRLGNGLTLTAIMLYYRTDVDISSKTAVQVIKWPASVFPGGMPNPGSNASDDTATFSCNTLGGGDISVVLSPSGVSIITPGVKFGSGDGVHLTTMILNAK